ncbi:hypothetical protein PMAYCL1PPCAC_23894 [Pristionchus mayeri]|uniref:Protein N-terminal glutamine amidohydrolase n=1 Tax=Pristionchus mayeri TaxID=1317129 RepID=A0AAN5I6W9_9BILA|nr:hypothetical protein PMAYCL1PPCAC_23894 [Pristionchus mayeri]
MERGVEGGRTGGMTGRRHGFEYQSCYCEENVYLMGKELSDQWPGQSFHVLFISNPSRSVLISNQRAKENEIVCWDYHVVLLHLHHDLSSIYDLDTRLPFPCPASQYLTHSFPKGVSPELTPLFRVLPLHSYLSYFSSDRSHMISQSGEYLSPPPSWPPINSPLAESPNQIDQFISMNPLHLSPISQVLNLDQMNSFCSLNNDA